MGEQRKLAAIMFTGIAGYSALMSKDEKLAMEVLDKNREIIIKESDVSGDVVNIASRIEAASEPGRIYMSERVYEALRSPFT